MSALNKEEKAILSNIFTEKYYQATVVHGMPYVSALILKLFNDSEVLKLLRNSRTTTESIITQLNFTSHSKFALEWMMLFLYQHGFLKKTVHNDMEVYFYDDYCMEQQRNISMEPEEIDEEIGPSCRLMEYVAGAYGDYFKGIRTGFDIVFSGNKMTLWNNYFSNENSGYRVYNQLGVFGIVKWFPEKDRIKFLELGGGTGSATTLLIDTLRQNNLIDRVKEYMFSDISPVFLRQGNISIMKHSHEGFHYSLRKLDFNMPLTGQGIEENEFDIVYGVNSLHVARNLIHTLREIYKVLKPGGLLIISECIRADISDTLVQEIIFNLLDDYHKVETDPCLRTTPGFLPYKQWVKIFRHCGFENIEIILNTDNIDSGEDISAYPKLAAVIKGVKY